MAACTAQAVGSDEKLVAQRWALLIGVDDYANANKLQYCGADQRALYDRLRASGFPEEQIFLMHDKAEENRYRPSQRNIEKQLDVVLGLAQPNDLIIVSFSGHGVSLGGKSYLCPNDATLEDPVTLVALDGLYDRLRDCTATFKLVMVDACRNDPRLGGARSLTATAETKALARSFQEAQLPEGVVLLNSCAPGEISREDDKFGHGVFMHFVLDGLGGSADKDGDGAVSLYELQSYAGLKTRTHVARQFNDSQRPFYKIEGEATAMEFALLPVRSDLLPSMPLQQPVPSPVAGGRAEVTNGIGMKLALIPAGEFLMGSASDDSDAADDEKPQHRVQITKPFYLGVTEVTQGQWESVMGTNPWSGMEYVKEGANYPATYVSWEDASEFCRQLSEKEGKQYRLPTEAEWEYACRADTGTKYPFGDDVSQLGDYAWYGKNAWDVGKAYALLVGTKKANPWGLHDMQGSVWEWCADFYDAEFYGRSHLNNPSCFEGVRRVNRGGSWYNTPAGCRSANRSWSTPAYRGRSTGFRVALVL